MIKQNSTTIRFINLFEQGKRSGKYKTAIEFCQKVKITPQSLNEVIKGRSNVGVQILHKTLVAFPEYNPGWLLTGLGNVEVTEAQVEDNINILYSPICLFKPKGFIMPRSISIGIINKLKPFYFFGELVFPTYSITGNEIIIKYSIKNARSIVIQGKILYNEFLNGFLPIHRIREFIDFKKISIAAFERSICMANASFGKQLKTGGSIGLDKLVMILNVYPELNPNWVLTGKGNMTSIL